MTAVWVDCRSGVSGDMLLGALAAIGVLDDLATVVESLEVDATVGFDRVTRGGLAATAAVVRTNDSQPHRRLPALRALLARAEMPDAVRERADRTLTRLATAEAAVHGVAVDAVELHEVGAVDTLIDVVGACLGFQRLAADTVVVGPIALGAGTVGSAHGELPVPGPAVLELLRRTPLQSFGGGGGELATPTGVALLAELASAAGPMPAMTVRDIGVGAGSRDRPDAPNVVRLVVGSGAAAGDDSWVLLEANVDDLDPRLWPAALDAILAAGAADTWLTPIVMKKGRPAHTLSALTDRSGVAAVRTAFFTHTSTIGVRSTDVGKHALEREWVHVDVDGTQVRVKVARLNGAIVNASPEWEDVASAARALGRPAKDVLAAAVAASGGLR